MKLILENWRQYLKEQQAKESLGVMVDYNEGYDEGSSEMEHGDIEDEQTYARGPYGEM